MTEIESNTVTFEVSTLTDTLMKANKIAPMSGKNVEQYAGFIIEIEPEKTSVTIRCTDGAIFYTEQVNVLINRVKRKVTWRIPSVTNKVVNALPQGQGKKVTFTEFGGKIIITSARTKASVRLINSDYYPEWELFDVSALSTIPNFGARVDQISWAASKDNSEITSGIHLDGEYGVATNRYRLARVPLKMPLDSPVTVPMTPLAPIIGRITDIRVGVIGDFLCIAPDEYTQIKCILFADDYLNIGKVTDAVHGETIFFNRELIMSTLKRILTIGSKDRQSILLITIGNEQMNIFAQDEGADETIEESVDITGQAKHEPMVIKFQPENFINAISKAPGMMVTLNYTLGNSRMPVSFDGDTDYKCWIPTIIPGTVPTQNQE